MTPETADTSSSKLPAEAFEELPVIQDFIDFVNRQVGVYSDCLSSFQGNKVRIERQVARINFPVSRRTENGQTIIMRASLEDPIRPDVIHHRIIRAEEFVSANSEAGFNERQVCWAIIVFLFAYWDEEIRPKLAKIRGVKPNDIQLDALGDLRLLRRCVVHNKGVIGSVDHGRLKILREIFSPDQEISPNHDAMHKIFIEIKRAISELVLHYTGHLSGAPKPGEIVGIAIQNARAAIPK